MVILGVLNRIVLLNTLGVDYVGYESVFKSLFSLLSFSELGVASVISFRLYKALAENNKNDIESILSLFKCLYLFIGFFVLALGLGLSFHLPLLLDIEKNSDWILLQVIFFFQLGETLCTYFLSYRRTLFIASQKEFVCAQVDLLFNVCAQVLQIVILVVFRNYILYLSISLIRHILANVLITYFSKKEYDYRISISTGLKEIKDKNFWAEIKNFSIQKIALLIWSSSDNLIIMYFLGSRTVGIYANYLLITGQVRNIVNGIYKAATAAVGSYVYQQDKDQNKDEQIFELINLGCFWGAAFAGVSLILLIQPTVQLLFGEQYLVNELSVLLIGINLYIEWSYLGSYIFRSTFGNFKYDRKYMCLSAITNVAISIWGAKIMGLSGVLIGTTISSMFIYWGRYRFVIYEYLQIPIWQQIRKRIYFHFIFVTELAATIILCNLLNSSIGYIGKIVICFVVPNCMSLLFLSPTKEFQLLKNIFTNHLKSRF